MNIYFIFHHIKLIIGLNLHLVCTRITRWRLLLNWYKTENERERGRERERVREGGESLSGRRVQNFCTRDSGSALVAMAAAEAAARLTTSRPGSSVLCSDE